MQNLFQVTKITIVWKTKSDPSLNIVSTNFWVLHVGSEMDLDTGTENDDCFDFLEHLEECELEEVDRMWDHDLREGVFLHEAKLLAMVKCVDL